MTNWLITGVSSGLGKALSRAAIARGDTVVGTIRREEDKQAFEAQAPGRAIGILMDLTEAGAAAKAVAVAEAALGQIDILVNNAGYGIVGAIEETDIMQARRLFDVNVFGPIAMIQAVLPAMRARRAGRIINITSVSGFAPWAGTAIYGASKYAMECIGQTLAQEVAPLGIHVTNVAPGGFRTEFASGSLAEAAHLIDDYEATAHQSKAILAMQRGKEHGDPARAAAVILQAADMAAPPRHLFLGEDALRHANEQIELVQEEMERWKDLSLSTAFPA
jgi:NAD(P)-dependent dehydrogenase (short-subunit alcohol dehydrogenase family)